MRRVTRSSTKTNGKNEGSAADRLHDMATKDDLPPYIALVFELLKEENLLLKQQLNNSVASNVNGAPRYAFGAFHASESETEVKRSIVLSNLPESSDNRASVRISHDVSCVRKLLDYLDIECFPTAVYRMGNPDQNRPRLIKVVLPASKFQREAVRRAPRLRFFPLCKGIYLRPSLSREERDRRRGERLATMGQTNVSSHAVPAGRESQSGAHQLDLTQDTLQSELNSSLGN